MRKTGQSIPIRGRRPLEKLKHRRRIETVSHTCTPTPKDLNIVPLKSAGRSNHPNLTTMRTLTQESALLDRRQFQRKYPCLFLVQQNELSQKSENAGYFTLRASLTNAAHPCDLYSASIYILRKKKGELFQDMITLGRVSNNDVVLDYSCVSKFHARFARIGNMWSLTDTGSTNGTYVDNQRLQARVSQLVTMDSDITIGQKLCFRLVDASKMFNYLDYLRRHSQSRS
jgi:hypothetical protein